MFNTIFCQWLDSNRRPLELKVTTLTTEPQPLPKSVAVSWYPSIKTIKIKTIRFRTSPFRSFYFERQRRWPDDWAFQRAQRLERWSEQGAHGFEFRRGRWRGEAGMQGGHWHVGKFDRSLPMGGWVSTFLPTHSSDKMVGHGALY